MEKASRDFSTDSRDAMASRGVAMPDGSYPIPDKDALRRAIASYGRAKDPEAVKRHIIKRARALGATDMLPEGWGSAQKGAMAAMHSAQAADILEDLYQLIACEIDETDQAQLLRDAADNVAKFLSLEAQEVGQPDDPDEMAAGDDYHDGDSMKATLEVKAEPMTATQLDRWLAGKTSRRILVVPFGGPIPSAKSSLGVDLDGEWFDATTDLYGTYASLRTNRERLVDWHHDVDPTGRMKGAILGHIVLDEEPEDDGYWADFWANAGEKRRALVAKLERGGVPLFGSSQAIYKKARDDGHIDEWPLIRHTITTSPQNTRAVVPPLKAILTMADLPLEEVGIAAVKAALLGFDDQRTRFPVAAVAASRRGGRKAGRVISARNYAQLRTFIDELARFVETLHGAPSDATTPTDSEGEPEQ